MALTLFPYVGGKSRHAKMVAALCDAIPHTCYIEPFAGAASIFFSKKPVKVNVLNDTNRNITAIFKALREEPLALMQLLYRMEYSEDLFYEAHRALFRDDLTTVQRAAYHLVLLHMMCGRPHVKKIEELPEKKQKALKGGGGSGFVHGAESGVQTTRVLGAGTDEMKIVGTPHWGFYHGTNSRLGAAPQTVLGAGTDEMKITGDARSMTIAHGTSDSRGAAPKQVLGAGTDELKIKGTGDGGGFAHGAADRAQTTKVLGAGTDEMKIHGCHNPAFSHGTGDCIGRQPQRIVGPGTDETALPPGEISMADLLGVPREFFGRYWHFINRLRRNVQIMNRDAFDLLKRLDKPGVLFYIDPPYEECRSKESYTGVDHNRLAELLTNMKHAKWIISQYDTELYNERYKDFKKIVKPTRMSAVGGTKHSPEHHKVVEAFWIKK